MKKDIIIGALLLILGIVIGLLYRPNHTRYTEEDERIDTVYETKYYSRLELVNNTYKLDVPKIGMQDYVYIAADSVTVIYKDSIQYVMFPREHYYTSVDDIEIWHSGFDSKIDSLNFKKTTISKTETVIKAVTKCNQLALGAEIQYNGAPYIPIYLEYSHLLHKNFKMFAKVSYDIPTQLVGAGMGVQVQFGW